MRVLGRRLVTINETERNDVLNESRVKFITSQDVITARDLYEKPIDFLPTHKTFLTTNNKPIVRGADHGIWRRIHLVPFTVTIEKPDVNFREKVLAPELPGILNWALEGLAAYQKDGLTPPAAVLEATNEYRDDMDLIGHWLEECCDLVADAESAITDLYDDYQPWANRHVGFSTSVVGFGRELVARGFQAKKIDRQTRVFRGLKLREPKASLSTNVSRHSFSRG